MIIPRGIPTFVEQLHKAVYRFAQQIEHSTNLIVGTPSCLIMYILSPICKWWSSVLNLNL